MSNTGQNIEMHGIWRVIPSQPITEIIAQSGFDFQILDCEHGAYDYQSLDADIRACDLYNCAAFVRVSGLSKVEVQRCLDLGASGIVFPQLTKYTDFEQAIEQVNYAPTGTRGFNPFVRAWGYGINNGIIKKAKCIVIIETLQAVDDLEQILNLAGIDMIYVGSYDLSAQLGCIGKMNDVRLTAVVNEIIKQCNAAAKPVGVMVSGAEQYNLYKDRGVNVFVHTVDTHQIKRAFTATIDQTKNSTK
jgi:4-hydroxy-2-oxoheptanedioate aldolase